jgi:AcrR family transcriptional regulator
MFLLDKQLPVPHTFIKETDRLVSLFCPDRSKEMLKERIVTEAIGLFLRKGFRNTTINDIIQAADISKGAFYWHFKSKNELLETIIKAFEETFLEPLIQTVSDRDGDFREKFAYYHKQTTEFALHNQDLCVGFMTLSAELCGNGSDLEDSLRKVYNRHRKFLEDLIQSGSRENVLKEDLNAEMTAHVIMAINTGMLFEWYLHQSSIDGRQFAKAYRDITLKGILKEM